MPALYNLILLFGFTTAQQLPSDTARQIDKLQHRSESYFYTNTDSALHYAQAAIKLATLASRGKDITHGLNDLAKIYYIKGDYYGSLAAANKSMTLSRKYGDTAALAYAINSRGLIFLAQDRFTDALSEFQRAATYNAELKDTAHLGANYFNIGICYDELKRYNDAMRELNKASFFSERSKDWHISLMELNRKGEVSFHSKNYTEALEYYQQAIGYENYHDDWESAFAHSGLAQTLLALNKPQMALPEAEQAYNAALNLKAAWDIRRAVDILARCYAALGNYREAFVYQRREQQWADSLLNENKERKINALHLQQKEQENNELMRVNEDSRSVIKRNTLIIAVIGALTVLLVAALIYLKRLLAHRNALNQTLKQNFDAITVQNEELEFHRKELVASNQAKDQVLSVLGHDLRAPFSTALQSIDLIRSGHLDKEEQQKLLNAFEQQLMQLTRLLNDLLEWAVSQQAGRTANLEVLNLSAVAADVLALNGSALESKQFVAKHDGSLARWVYTDKARLKIVLQNIIANAIKFTPRGGLLQVHYTQEHGVTAIHISDNGLGISKEKQDRLFRVSGHEISAPGTEQEPGTGLGLLLVKQLMDECGGKVRVKSQPGKGSEFMLLFETADAPIAG